LAGLLKGNCKKQAQQQSNGKGNCELQTANCELRTAKADPPPSAKDDNKKTTNDGNRKADQ
jgi:hypothetical protein